MTPLLSRLRHHLSRTRLLGEPGTAVLAVSGGADSVALLDLLHALAPELGLKLVVAHVDRSEEHTSELQSLAYLVCRLLLEKKKRKQTRHLKHAQPRLSYSAVSLDTRSCLR